LATYLSTIKAFDCLTAMYESLSTIILLLARNEV